MWRVSLSLDVDWTSPWTVPLIICIVFVFLVGSQRILAEWLPSALKALRRRLRYYLCTPAVVGSTLINPETPVKQDELHIFVVCKKEANFGGHAVLLFMWRSATGSHKYATAEFYPAKAMYSVSGPGSIKVSRIAEGVNQVPGLLACLNLQEVDEEYKFAKVGPYQIATEDIQAKINGLKDLDSTYSLSGNYQSLSLSTSTFNNNNCATWCAFVLRNEFGYLDLVQFDWTDLIRTPDHVLDMAAAAAARNKPIRQSVTAIFYDACQLLPICNFNGGLLRSFKNTFNLYSFYLQRQ